MATEYVPAPGSRPPAPLCPGALPRAGTGQRCGAEGRAQPLPPPLRDLDAEADGRAAHGHGRGAGAVYRERARTLTRTHTRTGPCALARSVRAPATNKPPAGDRSEGQGSPESPMQKLDFGNLGSGKVDLRVFRRKPNPWVFGSAIHRLSGRLGVPEVGISTNLGFWEIACKIPCRKLCFKGGVQVGGPLAFIGWMRNPVIPGKEWRPRCTRAHAHAARTRWTAAGQHILELVLAGWDVDLIYTWVPGTSSSPCPPLALRRRCPFPMYGQAPLDLSACVSAQRKIFRICCKSMAIMYNSARCQPARKAFDVL